MKSQLLLTLPLLLLSTSAFAQTVSEGEALDKALNFLQSSQSRRARGQQSSPQLTLAHKSAQQDETYYYVFNNQAGGFIIIGGDEVAQDVLGYADSGTFDYDQLPPNFRWWLSTYEHSISKSIRAKRANQATIACAPKRAASYPKVPHLLQTKWNQDMPYNALIPGNTPSTPREKQYATGCVATAVAQIMNYHQWPDHGWSSHKYQLNGYTYEADFGNTIYDWDLMQNTYDDDYTGSAEELEVAKLMYHVGVGVDMNYDIIENGGSGASIFTASEILNTYFGYHSGQYVNRESYSNADWENQIYSELANNRPVLYSGHAEDGGGHAFVCDGYENGKFHINWGWGGYCDGIYNLTPTLTEDALDPSGSGIGGAGEEETYKDSQAIVVGLKPNKSYDGCLSVLDIKMPYGGNYSICGEPFEIEYVLENSSSLSRTIADPTLFIYSGNGSEFYDYLDGEPDFVVGPHTTRSLKFSTDGAIPEWAKTKKDLILVLTDYSDKTRYIQHNSSICNPLNISYTLTTAKWGTLCLPFEAKVPEGLTAYKVTGTDGSLLVKEEVDFLQMNTPYLVTGTPDTYTFHGPATPEDEHLKNGLLVGNTLTGGSFAPEGSYALQNQPSNGLGFYQVNSSDYTIRQYTAYLAAPATLLSTRVLINSETGIHNVALDEAEATEMFNVIGQRTKAATGLVIKNGQLNFVK